MCGIAGVCGNVNIMCQAILLRISHRGPDGIHLWRNEDFAMGHARLSIIDLSSKADQPMTDELTGNVIIYNGEIYNYVELREELKDHPFRSRSDTEVILAAYNHWGMDFLSKLRGMFAFALFDRSKNSLLVARDRLGIKPFYFRSVNGGTIFSSEIKGLIKHDSVSTEVNELKAAEFLCARQLDCSNETLFKDIYQLLPGTYTWIDSNGKMKPAVKFWDFPKHQDIMFSPDKHGREFTDLFRECIKIHLRSDVPVGAFVSGGLDSSSVASFILEDKNLEQLHTFSAVLPVRNEENKLIDLVTNKPNVKKHEFYLDGKGFFDEIEEVVYHHDEPIQDGSMYSHYKLCEIASSQGVKVILSGSGGDELLGGYGSHIFSYLASTLKSRKLKKYLHKVKLFSENSGHTYSELIKKSIQELFPFKLRLNYKQNYFRKVAAHTNLTQYVDKLPFYYNQDSDPWTANYLNNYRSWSVPPYLHYEDRNSMSFGVEIRVPFYDHMLIEYISRFHPDSLMNDRSKSILRESFAGIVPNEILNQKAKFGFPSPMDTLLRDEKTTAPYFFEIIKDIPFLIPSKTCQLGIDFFNNKVEIGTFWRTLSLAVWYKKFFS